MKRKGKSRQAMRRRARSPRFDILVSSFIAPVACITFQAGLTLGEETCGSSATIRTRTRRADSHAHTEKTEAACDTIFVRAPISNFSCARDGFTLAFEFDVSNFGAECGRLW